MDMGVVRHILRAEQALADEYDRQQAAPAGSLFASDAAFCLAHELRLVVGALYRQALNSLRVSIVGARSHCAPHGSPENLAKRVEALQWLQSRLDANIRASLDAHLATTEGSWIPRVARVAAAYQLSPRERDALILLLLLQNHATSTFSSCFEDVDDGSCETKALRDLCGMNAIEIARFFEEERALVKEGVMLVREDDFQPGRKIASLSVEAAELCISGLPAPAASSGAASAAGEARGGEVRGGEAKGGEASRVEAARVEKLTLKLAGTKLLETVKAEHGGGADEASGAEATGGKPPPPPAAANGAVGKLLQSLQGADELLRGLDLADDAAGDEVAEGGVKGAIEGEGEGGGGGGRGGEGEGEGAEGAMGTATPKAVCDEVKAAVATASVDDADAPARGYDSELEYLDDQFSCLVQKIQLSSELAKQRVKHAEVEEQVGVAHDSSSPLPPLIPQLILSPARPLALAPFYPSALSPSRPLALSPSRPLALSALSPSRPLALHSRSPLRPPHPRLPGAFVGAAGAARQYVGAAGQGAAHRGEDCDAPRPHWQAADASARGSVHAALAR